MQIMDGGSAEKECSVWSDLPRQIKAIAEGESSSSKGIQSLLEKQTSQLSAMDSELGE